MTGRWSSQVRKVELKDLQANAMAIDCTGQLVLLAGRRALGIVNLNKGSGESELRKVPRQSKWEVSACQWNPHQSRSNVFITACNQRADIWSWDDCKGTITPCGSLKAHTRVISDLDWSVTDVNMLATCSGDAYAFLWDVRVPKKPAVSLQAVIGASQVKWNRVNGRLLATAHDGDIRIWDPRKGTTPVQYIAAHLSKVHGLDWSPTKEHNLASSSQDCTVKFWDIKDPKTPECKLTWSSPVWRARYTPSGDGLATVMVPQLRRGENSLLLWQLNDLRQPIHTFMGHQDVVLEFQWRTLMDDCGEYELISWSRDQSLRLWKLETPVHKTDGDIVGELDPTLTAVNDDLAEEYSENMDIPKSASSDTSKFSIPIQGRLKANRDNLPLAFTPPSTSFFQRDNLQSPQQPKSLHHEFTLVNYQIPNIDIEEMDASYRSCIATAHINNHMVKLVMLFPDSYPNNQPPDFTFDDVTTVNQAVQDKLKKVLQDTSLQHVRHNRSCIEPCLRQLVSSLEQLTSEGNKSDESPLYMLPPTIQSQRYINYYNYNYVNEPVPYPRTCGARFCGADFLVCFTNNRAEIRRSSSSLEFTPRTMSSFGAYTQGARSTQGPRNTPGATAGLRNINMFSLTRSPPNTDSVIPFHRDHSFKDTRKPRSRSKNRVRDVLMQEGKAGDLKKNKAGQVVIYNILCLMPLNKQLAENYVLDDSDLPTMCNKNATIAKAQGRRDLVQTWSLAAMATSKVLKCDMDPDQGAPWAMHPFGRKLFTSLLQYYASIYDVQTMAMLCAVFSPKYDPLKPVTTPPSPKPIDTYNAYHTIHPTDTTLSGWNFTISRIRRSNSWSNMSNETIEETKDPIQKEKEKHEQNMSMLDPNRVTEYDQYKRAYADILYRWKLFNKRSDVLKYVSIPSVPHKGIEFGAECQHCKQEVRGAQCYHCKNYVLQCVVCHISVKGWSSFCLACGHGGHTLHMMEWFRSHTQCPTGCGCLCLHDNPSTEHGSE